MEKYSTSQAEKQASESALLVELRQLLDACRVAFQQERVYQRILALFIAEILTLGRHTVTQLLRVLGVADQDWSAWYRLFSLPRFPEEAVGRCLLAETLVHVPAEEPFVVIEDAVIVPRTGSHVSGSSWWRGQKTAPFQRGLQRGQRFVGISWQTPIENSYCRAIPLRFLPAVTEKAVPSAAKPAKEWEAGLAGLSWVRRELDQKGRSAQPLVGVGDGSYDVQGIWGHLPERTTLVVRTARNRKLLDLADKLEGPRGPGRPALYGERLPTPAALLGERKSEYWTQLTLPVRGRERQMRYRIQGPCLVEGMPHCPLYLIVVGGQSYTVGKRNPRRRYREPYFLLVNAIWREESWQLPFPVERLLAWAWQRWECEVAHREMKSSLGIGEKQCWGKWGALTSVQWGVWVYSVCVLAAYKAWGITGGPRRVGGWYRSARRWSFTAMWQAYRSELWGEREFLPLCGGSLANWLKPELWKAGMWNALADPGRI